MPSGNLPVLAIIGHSNTGKTTLVEKLIGALSERGLRVATAKHHPHDLEIDRPGKDSYRHRRAGAVATMLLLPREIVLTADLAGEATLREIVTRYASDAHICLIEGCKRADVPKIEVYANNSVNMPLSRGDKGVVAIVTDEPVDLPIPRFRRDSIPEITDFIIDLFQLM